MRKAFWIAAFSLTCLAPLTGQGEEPTYRVVDEIEIDSVPSWFPVGFCLLTHDDQQYVAYYNAEHQMMVARRKLDERKWQKVELPSKVGWDTHNYITMAVDSTGNVHLSGNMHCVPLIYFRTQKPGDIATFERLPMTGEKEQRCTYPRFINDADGNLLFMYRDGGSGNGRRFFNKYDVETKTWSRFFDSPLFEGGGKRNAYPVGPKKYADGLFHVVWVWRETPDCATNHDLSYVRSRDLVNWETADGKPVELPITIDQTELCVDPVPVGGGMINSGTRLTLDSKNRPVIGYHKSDEDGNMQIYLARFEGGEWKTRAITDWKKPIPFGGCGAMPFFGIHLGDLKEIVPGALAIDYNHRDYGVGNVIVDEKTLRPLEREIDVPVEYPRELHKPTIDFKGIRVNVTGDIGSSGEEGVKYALRWETLGSNHDRPRQPPLPPASTLKLIKLELN